MSDGSREPTHLHPGVAAFEAAPERRLASETWLMDARRIARVGSWEWQPARGVVLLSEQMCAILGLDAKDSVRTMNGFADIIHPEDMPRTSAAFQRALSGGEPLVHEYRITRPDGRVRMLHSRGQLIEGDDPTQTKVVGTSWDITDLWETASWPERSVSLLRATLEASADGLLVVDRTGNIVTYNQRFLELWRIPQHLAETTQNAALIQHVAKQLVDPEFFIRTTRENQAEPDQEYFVQLRFKDGRTIERFSRPQRFGNEIIGRVLTFRDVTERERLLEQAQDAVRLRDEFLSIAAHEIRGPITSMRLTIQSLRRNEPPDSATVARALEIIDRGQRRLADFVDKLLDLARIRTGRLQLELERLDLTEVAREVVTRHAVERARTGPDLQFHGQDPVVGQWDPVRLDQVVENLVSNAIKFSAGRPVEVTVTSHGDVGVLVVRDHGIGIAPDVRERMFQPFERGVSLKNYGGLGLGLHIVRTIVEAMGGTIAVDSAPGEGATFVVELPKGPA